MPNFVVGYKLGKKESFKSSFLLNKKNIILLRFELVSILVGIGGVHANRKLGGNFISEKLDSQTNKKASISHCYL